VISDDLSTILSAFIGPPDVPKPPLIDFLMLELELIVESIVYNFEFPESSFFIVRDYEDKGGFEPLVE
jgi:hypothetical protein